MTQRQKTQRLVRSGVFLALAVLLSLIKISPEFLYGGSVTAGSMIPVVLLGLSYGSGWGVLCGLVYGVLQALLGATGSQAFAGLTPLCTALMAALDYLVAFGVLGLSGLARRKKPAAAGALGAVIGAGLRYVAHFLSGMLLWGSYASWFFAEVMPGGFADWVMAHTSGWGLAAIYSAVYNGLYMVPEILLTAFGTAAVLGIRPLQKQLLSEK